MSYASQVIPAALHKMQGTLGELYLALERKQPIPKAQVLRRVTRLRAAADELEKLL